MSSNKADVKPLADNAASVLSYNVPEPTTYSGRTYIELTFPDDCFIPVPSAPAALAAASRTAAAPSSPAEELRKAKQSGERLTGKLASLTEEEVERAAMEGKKLLIHRTMTGALSGKFVKDSGASAQTNLAMRMPLPTDDGSGGVIAGGGIIAGGGGVSPTAINDDNPTEDPGGGGGTVSTAISCLITSPAAGANIPGLHTGASFTVSGTAKVTSGGGSIQKVLVKVGNNAYQQATLSSGTWTLAATVTQGGPVAITAEATHSDGITKKSHTINVSVQLAETPDTVPPAVKISSPRPGQLFATGGQGTVAVTVEGTASDDRRMGKVELILDNGAPIAVETTNGFAGWRKTITLNAGSHKLVAQATDEKGNVGSDSLTFSVDAAPPQLTITSPANNAQVTGTYSQFATVAVQGTAQDDGGISHVEVSLDKNPIYVRAAEKAPGDWSEWTASVKIEEPGLHFIGVRAIDKSGNTIEQTIQVNVTIMPDITSRKNRIILIESYRLSSFAGRYGCGRTLKSFSLLPGEKSKISIKTYTQKEETMKTASSIFDSVTDENAEEFEKSIGSESSNKDAYEESEEYKLEASMGVSWGGMLSASASASTSGTTNAAREQLVKNIVNATQKHVSKASARRDVQVDTSYEVKTTTSEDTAIVREIENVNLSRTLNFVFRQMNQEIITLLHLVDIRIGFFRTETLNGGENPFYREVTLPELNELLKETIVDEKIPEVRNAIMHQLTHIFDYKDRHHVFVEEEPFKDADGKVVLSSSYLRVKKDYVSEYLDEATGTSIAVPGIIMAANRHVLRTDGIVVESVLGHGEALDDYSRSLQEQTAREKELQNDKLEAEVRMKQLAIDILASRDQAAAQLYAMLNPACARQAEEEPAAEALVSR